MQRMGNAFALLLGVQIVTTTVESSMEISQKMKKGSAFWPSDPTSGIISKGTQNTNSKEHKHQPYVHFSVIYNSQDMEAAKMPISGQMDKEEVAHIFNRILFGHKKNKILPFLIAWMNLEGILLTEVSQTGKG